MPHKRGNPTARAGNYAQEADTAGMDESMKKTLYGTKMDKTESNYVKSRGNAPSAREAVQRARKANKKPPVREDY